MHAYGWHVWDTGFLKVYFTSKHIDVVFKTLAVPRDITADNVCSLICQRFNVPAAEVSRCALYEVWSGITHQLLWC